MDFKSLWFNRAYNHRWHRYSKAASSDAEVALLYYSARPLLIQRNHPVRLMKPNTAWVNDIDTNDLHLYNRISLNSIHEMWFHKLYIIYIMNRRQTSINKHSYIIYQSRSLNVPQQQQSELIFCLVSVFLKASSHMGLKNCRISRASWIYNEVL